MRLKEVKLRLSGWAILTLAATLFSWSLTLQAQEKQPPRGEKGKKQTKIDFEDELVEGELKKPELFYLLQKKQFNFKRLIKLRDDFLPEMRRDADEVRRSRSK